MMVEFTKVFLFLRDCVPIVRGLALVVKTCCQPMTFAIAPTFFLLLFSDGRENELYHLKVISNYGYNWAGKLL